MECFVVGKGKWHSPGGSTKQFLLLDMDLVITWYAHKQNSLTFNGEDGNLLIEKLIQLCVDSSSSKLANCSTECLISDGLDKARMANNDGHNNIMDLSCDISTTLQDPLSLSHSSNDGDLQVSNLNLSFSPNSQTKCGDFLIITRTAVCML